jgi:hypothetical protein
VTPPAVAAVWVVAGIAGSAALPALRLRRAAAVLPGLGLLAVLLAAVSPSVAVPTADTGLGPVLDRTAQGVLAVSAVSAFLFLVRSARIQGPELRTFGVCGAAAVIVLTVAQPVVWAITLLIAMAVMGLRWVSIAPARATLATGRAALAGAAGLLAAAPLLPVSVSNLDARPLIVAGIVGTAVAILLGVVPVGGWALAALTSLPAVEVAAWPLVLLPALLLAVARAPAGLPAVSVVIFGHILLLAGLLGAAWQAIQAARGAGPRYVRVLLADVGLATAAIGVGLPGLALAAVLLTIVTHLILAPLLLDGDRLAGRPRSLAWALLSGLPPAPSFWARLLVLEGMADIGGQAIAAALLAAAALTLASLLAMRRSAPRRAAPVTTPAGWLPAVVDWTLLGAGAAVGLMPSGILGLLFGGQ